MRAAHYLLGPEHALWALLYADDGNLLDGTDNASISVVGALFILEAGCMA